MNGNGSSGVRKGIANHMSDLIHSGVVLAIVIAATTYTIVTNDHSSNIWIVYGSGIAFAAGRAGVSAVRSYDTRARTTDQP